MPSLLHEALLLLFRNRPELAAELRDALHRFEVVVVGPETVPVVDDREVATVAPELAVLSVLAHAAVAPDPYAMGDAALFGLQGLTDERQRLYSDLILDALPGAARATLEAKIDERTYVYRSDFAKKHQAKGRAEGLAEGEAKGLAEGQAEAVLAVLDARGLGISDEARARIRACTDRAQLAAWVRKAVTAACADEIF